MGLERMWADRHGLGRKSTLTFSNCNRNAIDSYNSVHQVILHHSLDFLEAHMRSAWVANAKALTQRLDRSLSIPASESQYWIKLFQLLNEPVSSSLIWQLVLQCIEFLSTVGKICFMWTPVWCHAGNFLQFPVCSVVEKQSTPNGLEYPEMYPVWW